MTRLFPPPNQDSDHFERLATAGTLASLVAHEINNVLTPVLNYAQLAQAHPQDRELMEKALSRTVAGVQTATEVSRSMLGFTRPADQEQCANISQCLGQALNCIGRPLGKDHITLNHRVDESLHAHIQPVMLQQIFINIIMNARQALLEYGGTIVIQAHSLHDQNIMVTMTDDGPGIEIGRDLFTPFASSTTGHGLGLPICKALIEAADGTISIHSTPGKGTEIDIVLPTANQRV